MLISKELKEAIDEYLRGTASLHQQTMVNDWYRQFNDEEVEVDAAQHPFSEDIEQRIRERLTQTIQKSATRVVEMYPIPARNTRRWWLAAAAILLLAVGIWFLLPADKVEIQLQIVQTQTGETKKIMLPDSSIVWLNAMSSIEFPAVFNHIREVTIKGEAFFDIRHQHNKSFVVHAGKTSTTVLGTAFSVSSYQPEQQVIVNVVRGRVQVSDTKTTSSVLTAGKQLHYTAVTGQMMEQQTGMTGNPAWMEGKLVFDAMPLQEITAILSRWYNVQFEFENDAIRHCKYTGNFTNDMKLTTVLQLFSQINNITYKINNNETQVILTGAGCK